MKSDVNLEDMPQQSSFLTKENSNFKESIDLLIKSVKICTDFYFILRYFFIVYRPDSGVSLSNSDKYGFAYFRFWKDVLQNAQKLKFYMGCKLACWHFCNLYYEIFNLLG